MRLKLWITFYIRVFKNQSHRTQLHSSIHTTVTIEKTQLVLFFLYVWILIILNSLRVCEIKNIAQQLYTVLRDFINQQG